MPLAQASEKPATKAGNGEDTGNGEEVVGHVAGGRMPGRPQLPPPNEHFPQRDNGVRGSALSPQCAFLTQRKRPWRAPRFRARMCRPQTPGTVSGRFERKPSTWTGPRKKTAPGAFSFWPRGELAPSYENLSGQQPAEKGGAGESWTPKIRTIKSDGRVPDVVVRSPTRPGQLGVQNRRAAAPTPHRSKQVCALRPGGAPPSHACPPRARRRRSRAPRSAAGTTRSAAHA